MAGNTVLIKPSPTTAGCLLEMEQAMKEAGFDNSEFQVLLASTDQTEDILSHKDIAGLAFTGSSSAGRKVAEIAGRNLKKASLELGGSDPFIVLQNSDAKKAAQIAAQGRLLNSG